MSAWNFKDLTGQRFGRLTVIERAENKGKIAFWKCRCECGAEKIVQAGHLTSGHTKSCGCLIGQHHGLRYTKIYNTWSRIKKCCLNPQNIDYKDYGGRGITMFPAWIDDFLAFYEYVSTLPHFGEEGYSLDRIDNNGNYEPGNLRFADNKTQCRNKRNNIIVEYEDVEMTLVEASELSGINHNTLLMRYHRGDRGDRLFRAVKN